MRALSAELHQRHLAERRQVARLAAAAGIPVRRVLPDGRIAELQRFINGRPQCYITTNLDAARTVGTDLVWPGGGLGLDLTGAGMSLGIWDEGGVLTTHQEFGSRVVAADGSTGVSDHATHVAGTMIASGFFEPLARGMASEAGLQSYDWFDDSGEMAAAAAAGLALSNHSYSYIVGWQENYPNPGWNWWGDVNISPIEDYFFGFYDSTASDWDQIAASAPTYLIVAAAGNDRGENGPSSDIEEYWWWNPASGDTDKWETTTLAQHPRNPDGDFDCLPGGPQVAKNVLVVGAVDDIPTGYTDQADVVVTPFSSWGPADDGRIKPDLVANGWQLYSTRASSSSSYGYSSGTSMAAPNVTGSVALLQQHYRQTHNDSLPRAATLRGLLIHTADEAGTTPGPDYIHGWGLLNTAAAAKLISRDTGNQRIIQETILNQYEIFSASVTSDGTDPLKVTIAWTDPRGTVPSPRLNPRTPVLVNDLDLRITRESDGQVYYPWRLDVEHPDWAADRFDNSVDNVEQVLISTPAPGEYTVTVSHKNTLLAGAQGFSMVITGEGMPQILVWEGDSAGVDYSGVFIRDTLPVVGEVEVTYTTTFPESLSVFDAVFLSFGPPPGIQPKGTTFNDIMAEVVRTYLEDGGSLYLEGGDALGAYQVGNNALLALLGIESAADGYELPNPIDGLEGQPSALTSGMSFNSSTQFNTAYIDSFVVSTGMAAFVESDYGTVAVQHTGSFGQRTFVFSYALAELADGAAPSTRSDLLATLLDFFVGEAPPPPNNPPEITSAATATATEDELFVYHATATDPEDDALTFNFDNRSDWLTITGGDSVAGTPGEGVTSGSFRVIASDGQLNDYLEVTITVSSANDPPVFISTIPDTSFMEDSTLSLPLSLWFQAVEDQETPDSLLIWTITGNDNVSTTLSADSVFFKAPLNWHGVDTLSVIASDSTLAATTSLVITVFPVNDAPEVFALLEPADGDTAKVEGDSLMFRWEAASDVDSDTLKYALYLSGFGLDTAALDLGDTHWVLRGLECLEADSTYRWHVEVTDGQNTTAGESKHILVGPPVLGVDLLVGIPAKYALHQNYPNPFNPNTTIRFALPEAAAVYLVVYDLLGREVARLVDETLPAGYHRVVWDGRTHRGKEAPSGVYIAYLFIPPTLGPGRSGYGEAVPGTGSPAGTAPGFVHQVKMVLLR